MKFARAVWKILVAIKDGLVLLLLLLFFGTLSLALSSRPMPGRVKEGALAITLDGPVVEEKARIAPSELLLDGDGAHRQYVAHDLVRAIEAAATDTRIRAVTLDLEGFGGAGQVTLSRLGEALDKVRGAGKPVLVRAVLYDDDALQLAAHASEIWVDPLGGVMVRGPGGTLLFYHGLLDRLKVKAHVFKVGTYKSAVEPYIRDSLSPEAREAETAVYTAVWHDWLAEVKKARPRANLALVTSDPVKWLAASDGNAAEAAKAAGLVDRIGDKVAFGKRAAEIVGGDRDQGLGGYKATRLGAYLADLPAQKGGKAIAVVNVEGAIVDGNAGPGVAGGDRIAALIDRATASGDYAGMVLRVDSPGGSVTGAERIRAAVERFKASGLPVAVSMGNLAASGGYWVSTPADRIFAEPATITGSIGIFAVIPSFEDSLAKFGVTTDGLRTTPLSGQPSILGGFSPEMEAVLQTEIDAGYHRFVGLVSASRHKSYADVDRIAQGRVWDGGTARQIGLVDEFGNLDNALNWVAGKAGATKWHPTYLGEEAGSLSGMIAQLLSSDDDGSTDSDGSAVYAGGGHDLAARVATAQFVLAGRMASDLDVLMGARGAQAYCLECAGLERGFAGQAIGGGAGPVSTLLGAASGRPEWLLWAARFLR
ncbi:signal peptide peptidase SppA, 67K type [Novosphingobium nitrogenifigens DSM 19370]|uniref:Signal peptide peptidase SppA, 67K type n=1 Tax=Novosphingobium nitrogenifigens DSM 19370 TaxID=983920 RepID=F1Z7K1_9SPHN|nr:signal peptide peptidase SppA [Novosphingobium nitrogenifigens]EGD59392.1 signal peptide peptidase SppA, 67K type [Novosphingobium nitrogenifigens DSM 19370]